VTLTKLTEDLNKVQALDDQPNANGGLTAAQVKAVFDDAGNAIKDFINDILTEEIAVQFATQEEVDGIVLGAIPDGSLTYVKLTPAPASTATANALMKRDANGRSQTADPSAAADVATKGYVDAYRPYVSGTYTGNGTNPRTISLPFTPAAVISIESNNGSAITYSSNDSGLAVTGSPVTNNSGSTISVTTNGFIVTSGGSNINTYIYNYIAFK